MWKNNDKNQWPKKKIKIANIAIIKMRCEIKFIRFRGCPVLAGFFVKSLFSNEMPKEGLVNTKRFSILLCRTRVRRNDD